MKLLYESIGKMSGAELQEEFLTIQIGLALPNNHFMYELLEESIRLLMPSGVLRHDRDFYKSSVCYKTINEIFIKRPKILSINDLEFGFVIWLVACGFSITAFVIEVSYVYLKYTIMQITGLIYLLNFIKNLNTY